MMWRMYLVYFMLCLFGIVVLFRVFRIQVDTVSAAGVPAELLTDLRTIEAVRGNIYSDNGSLLATSLPVYEIRMDLRADGLTDNTFYDNVDSLALCLSGLFRDKTSARYRADLIEARKDGNRYFLVKNKVRHQELQKAKKFPVFRLGKNKGGFIVIKENKRSRPYGLLAARLIGYERPDPDNPQYHTRVGLEGAYSDVLRGADGKQLMKKVGTRWLPVSDEFEVNPVDGADLYTTIDINIQDVAENALLAQLRKYEAKSGCVVLMEVETGYIKAMANLERGDDGNYDEEFNQAIGVAIEPGSTFKLAALMAAFEDGLVRPTDSVRTGNGEYRYYNLTMKDTKPHGTITVQEAFEVSSNIGCSRPIFENYQRNPHKFIERLRQFGLDQPLGLEIIGEAKPYIKDPSRRADWSGVTLPQMAIGYELKLAPIHVLAFYNAVANNGKMVKPLFVKEIRRNGKVVQQFDPVVLREKICSDRTLSMVRPMLEGVVEKGTATVLKAANFSIAGKTGTAQILTEGTYARRKYLASFVGYFPADKPKYTCIVSIMEPNVNTGYYGISVAGPVFKEIADKLYARSLEMHRPPVRDYLAARSIPETKPGKQADIRFIYKLLNIPVSSENEDADWVSVGYATQKATLRQKEVAENTVPGVLGMGLKDALYLLENTGLNVQIKGSGKVRSQSIPEGQPVRKGQQITIELS